MLLFGGGFDFQILKFRCQAPYKCFIIINFDECGCNVKSCTNTTTQCEWSCLMCVCWCCIVALCVIAGPAACLGDDSATDIPARDPRPRLWTTLPRWKTLSIMGYTPKASWDTLPKHHGKLTILMASRVNKCNITIYLKLWPIPFSLVRKCIICKAVIFFIL